MPAPRWLPILTLGLLAACEDPAPAAPAGPAAPVVSSATAAPPPAASTKQPTQPSRRVDRVVLLTIDALRGDQPWTGYMKASTPNLLKLVDQSVVYTRAYSIANTTGPSISSMLAVRYPTELERDNCPLAGFTIGEGLGPVLKAAGVWTGAAHGHAYFGGNTAPKGGFVDWRTVKDVAGRMATQGAVTGPEVTELALALLEAAPKDQPSFIWAHYLEPHDSYVYHTDFPPSDEPRRGVYDGEVAAADHLVGKIVAAIDASPMKDRTAIIIAADHGEAFGEHERYRHGFTVYEEEIWIPLIVRVPGQPHRRIDKPRSAMDIPRTIADLLGVQAPARWRGTSLVRDLVEGKEVEDRPVIVDVPELMNLPAQQVVVFGSRKVTRFGPKWAVYDVGKDPKERQPLPKKANEELIDRAKEVLSTIEFVPHSQCTRKAFKD